MLLEIVIPFVACLIIIGPIFAHLLYKRKKQLKKRKQRERHIMQNRERRKFALLEYVNLFEKKDALFDDAIESDDILIKKLSEIKTIDSILCEKEGMCMADKQAIRQTEFSDLRAQFLAEAAALNKFDHDITDETKTKDIEKMCAALHGRIQTSRTYFEFVLQRLHDIVDAALKIRLALYYGDDQQKPASPSAPKLSAEKAALFSRDKIVASTATNGARVGFGRK